MSTPAFTEQQLIILSYRHLYRTALKAVHYSKPARYTIRDRLRWAFRNTHRTYFCQNRTRNTLDFLRNARFGSTLEKRVFTSLLHAWYWDEAIYPNRNLAAQHKRKNRDPGMWKDGRDSLEKEGRAVLDRMVRGLNESMGMCLR